MGILEAILLGIIQGIAEFLPISSSGHLAIFQKLFGMDQVMPPLCFLLLYHETGRNDIDKERIACYN